MVFFKQYLITLTCIVISVWYTPVNTSYTNIEGARANCKGILTCAGFGNTRQDNIEKVDCEVNLKTNYATLKPHVDDFMPMCSGSGVDDGEKYMKIGLYFGNKYKDYYGSRSASAPLDHFCEYFIGDSTKDAKQFLKEMEL